MIIDLTVQNFRSFRDEAMFSMHVEHPRSHLVENIAYPLDERMGILKTAAIYGPNASGKSNMLTALSALRWIVRDSGSLREGRKILCYEPYLLSEASKDAPTSFEIEFVIPQNHRYIYSVTYNADEIISESLDFYPTRQKANIFTRAEGDTWETINFGNHYKGGAKRIAFFKNNSYLSAAGNNASTPKMIRVVYEYFQRLMTFNRSQKIPVSPIYENDKMLSWAINFMQSVDTGVKSITKQESNDDGLKYFAETVPESIRARYVREHKYKFLFSHENETGSTVSLPFKEESDGTQQIFKMLPFIISSLRLGGVLVIDEIENSFHPHIAGLIIELFNNAETNPNYAQLIFTTHNLQIMTPSIMRRDQIWFTKKTLGSSEIFSLDEFDKETVTPSSPYNNWYNEGRFGAIPEVNRTKIFSFISTLMTPINKENFDISGQMEDNEDA